MVTKSLTGFAKRAAEIGLAGSEPTQSLMETHGSFAATTIFRAVTGRPRTRLAEISPEKSGFRAIAFRPSTSDVVVGLATAVGFGRTTSAAR